MERGGYGSHKIGNCNCRNKKGYREIEEGEVVWKGSGAQFLGHTHAYPLLPTHGEVTKTLEKKCLTYYFQGQ